MKLPARSSLKLRSASAGGNARRSNVMDREQVHEYLWSDFSPSSPPTSCAYARKFKEWADALCVAVGQDVQKNGASAVVAVNQAKVLLVDKYFEWRAAAPKTH